MTFCGKCGNQLDQDTKFCEKCGQAVGGMQPPAAAVPYYIQPTTSAPPVQVVPPRAKKPKGMVSKVIGILLMAAVTVLLNYFGIPGYITALVLGLWGGAALLSKNQKGKLREKLALAGAALLGVAVYGLVGLRFGAYAGVLVFVGAGLGLTRLYKQKTNMKDWLLEVAPVALYIGMFERMGGAVSNVSGIIDGIPVGVIVRYIEAALLLIAFIVALSLYNKQPDGSKRERVVPKRKKFLNFGKFLLVVALLLIWFNPFGVLAFDNIKSNIWDWLDGYGEGKSVVTTISNTNGTSLLMVKGAGSVTSEAAALELLSQYDKELDGEYTFADSVVLPSGNTLYRFAQVSGGIAVDGGAKNLVVDASGKPLYVAGQTKIISKNLTAPKNILSESQAKNALQEQFEGLDASIDTPQKVWYFGEGEEQSSYRLAYKAALTLTDEDGEITSFSAVLDAVTGEILDISFEDDGFAAVLQEAKQSGTFEDADFEAITKAAGQILSGTHINAWRYRDVLEQECLSFYAHKGDDRLGKRNVAAIVSAFASAGAKGANVDEGVIGVDLKSSRVKLKGTINYAYNSDDIIISQDNGMAQKYTFTTAVPVTLYVRNTDGQHILTLPVFDMETFELYPSSPEEQFVVTIQGGSRFQSTAKTSFAPALPGMIMAQAAVDDLAYWEGEVNASYELTIEQLSGGDSNATNYRQLLRKVEKAYNDGNGNGARYVALYRFDQLSDKAQEIYEPMAEFGPSGAALSKLYKSFSSTRWFSTVAQTLLISYRVANEMIAPMWKGIMAQTAQIAGGDALISDADIDKMVSNAPDKTIILASLFVINGKLDYFESMTNPRHEKFGLLTNLKDTKLSLVPVGRPKIEGARQYVTVRATVTRGGAVVLSETITILVQSFGEATGGGPADLGPDAAWFTSILAGMRNTFSRGIFLGFDMERMFDLWFEGATENGAGGAGEIGAGEDEQEKARITTPLPDEDLMLKAAALSLISYDDNWSITPLDTVVKKFQEGSYRWYDKLGETDDNNDKNWGNRIWRENPATFGDFYRDTIGDMKLLCVDAADTSWNSKKNRWEHAEPGFFAIAVYDNKNVFVVYRGTDEPPIVGNNTDGNDYNGDDMKNEQSQFKRAWVFYQETVKRKMEEKGLLKNDVIFCGHSLGGGLADSMSMQTGLRSMSVNGSTGRIITKVYTIEPYFSSAWPIFRGVDLWNFNNSITEKEPSASGGPSNFNIAHKEFDKYHNRFFSANPNTRRDFGGIGMGYHGALSQIDYVNGRFVYNSVISQNPPDSNYYTIQTSDWVGRDVAVFGTSKSQRITTKEKYIFGGDGDDIITALSKGCVFVGGNGDDVLKAFGNNGADRYYYYKGHGHDTIQDYGGKDVITLAGFDEKRDKITWKENSEGGVDVACNGKTIITVNRRVDPIELRIYYSSNPYPNNAYAYKPGPINPYEPYLNTPDKVEKLKTQPPPPQPNQPPPSTPRP